MIGSISSQISVKKITTFILSFIFVGLPAGVIAGWGFQIQGTKEGLIFIAVIAGLFGLLCTYACPKKTERFFDYFMTLFNP